MRKIAIALAALTLTFSAAAQTEVRWFVGLGAGTDEPTIAAQEAVVEAYNASQDDIELILEIVDNDQAYDVLATQIAAGNAPDIVGPMGIRGRSAFPGIWLDMSDLIETNAYDLSDFDPALVDFYNVEGEGQLGIPFAVFPSYLTYNKVLFDEAGLPYPPHEYGAPYTTWEGETVPWDLNALRDLAMLLTVDANGADATMGDFDPEQIEQWGYGEIWTDMRGRLSLFGSGNFADEDGNAIVPDHWAQGTQWIHDAMWKDHFMPNGAYGNSALLAEGNWVESGNLAIGRTHLWYQACCMFNLTDEWDIAAVPAGLTGEPIAKLHADTFGIVESSRNHDVAFEVLTHLLSPEIANELAGIYGGMPARISLQGDYLDQFAANTFPDRDVDWSVVTESLGYPDKPSHEGSMPNFREAENLYNAFSQRLDNEADFDVDFELQLLQAEMQLLFDSAR
jgi:multiple sugar transport system substrate-binding protein